MMTKRTFLSTLALVSLVSILSTPANEAFAQATELRKHGYACDGNPALFQKHLKAWAKELSSTLVQERYLFTRIRAWDAKYIKAGCEALLAGNPWDDSCLHGRQILEEIEENLPSDFNQLTSDQVFELTKQDQSAENMRAAFKFCKANNIYK